MFKPQAAFGDRAGLVRADTGHPAYVFHGDAASHQGLAAGQPIHAHAQKHGEDHRELFRQRRHGQGGCADQRVEPVMPLPESHRGQNQAENGSGHHQELHQAADGDLQGCLLDRPRAGGLHDLAVEGFPARENNLHVGRAGQKSGSGESPLVALQPDGVGSIIGTDEGHRVMTLGYRQRLTGKGGFIDLDIQPLDDAAVGGKGLAGLDAHPVPRNQLGGWNGAKPAVAHDHGRIGQLPAQALGGSLRAPVQKGIHADERQDGNQEGE